MLHGEIKTVNSMFHLCFIRQKKLINNQGFTIVHKGVEFSSIENFLKSGKVKFPFNYLDIGSKLIV